MLHVKVAKKNNLFLLKKMKVKVICSQVSMLDFSFSSSSSSILNYLQTN